MSQFTSYTDVRTQNAFVNPLTRVGQVRFFTSPNPVDVDELAEHDFHIMSSAAKKLIFHKHLPTQAAQEKKGRAILERLTQLSPSIASHFSVKSDLVEKMTFRLWAQRETEHSEEDSYIALSYCWDSEAFPFRPDVKYALPIPPLMFSALASEREWRSTGVWIDQLCIDQKNKEEKGVSVAAMDSVYRCASFVVVALLDVQVPLRPQDFLREYVPEYESHSEDDPLPPHLGESPPYFESHPELKRVLYTILSSRWFSRAWCAHEMELGENFVFYVPCQPVSANMPVTEMLWFTSTFLWDLILLSAEVPEAKQLPKDVRDRLAKVFHLRKRVAKAYQSLTGKPADSEDDDTKVMPYSAQIRDIFELGAGGDPDLPEIPRATTALLDKMSIVLNTLGNGLAVVRDLDSPLTEDECLKRLLLLGLAANDPSVLCTMGSPLKSSTTSGKVSWLCKPTYEDLGSGSERRDLLPRMFPILTQFIHLDPSPHSGWITLDVFALPPPEPPSERHRSLAQELTQKASELGMGRGPPGPMGDPGAPYVGKNDIKDRVMLMAMDALSEWGVGPLYQFWHNETFIGRDLERFNSSLACLLDCGKKWTIDMTRKCGYPQPPHIREKLDAYFHSNTFSGLDDMAWTESPAGLEAVTALLSTAMWMVVWGAKLPHGEQASSYMPMLFGHGISGKAVVFTVTDALVQTVMPGPLIQDEYSRLYRIWQLQAKDDPYYEKMMAGATPEWFLRSKAMLFTDVEVKDFVVLRGSSGDGRPGWRLRESVTVHGPPEGFVRE